MSRQQNDQHHTPIIGISENIQRIKELIKHVADTGLNILVTGETGVGKEVIARNLYENSARKAKPFVKVNCAALPEGLLESELYGYEKGAFTGAQRRTKGKFELAHGGVLFLDEIGDMSLGLQSKLLHVLQTGEFAPLGSEKEVRTDTWVIAATNHDLEAEIRKKTFREDLFYRLSTIKIYIPPLRNRPEDIEPLIDFYIDKYIDQYKDRRLVKPSNGVVQKLVSYHWPGNVRELQNVLKRIMILGNWDETIDELPYRSSIDAEIPTEIKPVPAEMPVSDDFIDLNYDNLPNLKSFGLKSIKKQVLDRVEKEVISYVLGKTGWNRSKAAKILKISYKTLLNKITELNLEPPNNSKDETSLSENL